MRVARKRRTADAIVTRVAGYDLLVVATHGRHGLSRAWIGSVAEKVVRRSPVPVLVVRGAPPQPGDARILIAVDAFEERADALMAEGGRWAWLLGARADAAHVVGQLVTVDRPDLDTGAEAELAALERAASARRSRLVEGLPPEVRGVARVGSGEPATSVAAWTPACALVVAPRTSVEASRGWRSGPWQSGSGRSWRSCRSP